MNPETPLPKPAERPVSKGAHKLEQLAQEPERGIVREFLIFVRTYRNWWLVPILVSVAILAALLFVGSTGAAPFVYSLF